MDDRTVNCVKVVKIVHLLLRPLRGRGSDRQQWLWLCQQQESSVEVLVHIHLKGTESWASVGLFEAIIVLNAIVSFTSSF